MFPIQFFFLFFRFVFWFHIPVMNPIYPIQLNNGGTKTSTSFFVCRFVFGVLGRPYLDLSHHAPQVGVPSGWTNWVKLHKTHFVARSWFVFDMKWIVSLGFCVSEASRESILWLAQENTNGFWFLFILGISSPCVSFFCYSSFVSFHCSDYCFILLCFFCVFCFVIFSPCLSV